MSELVVGSLKGLAANGFVIDVASGSKIVQPGSILQVVSTAKTDTFISSSTSYTAVTGMNVSITPTSATSKILIMAQLSMSMTNVEAAAFFRITGGNTSGFVGDSAGSRQQAVLGGFNSVTVYRYAVTSFTYPIIFLDSPATTSATTYQIEGLATSGSFVVNRSGIDEDLNSRGRTVSSITVMEVAG
jgi:hypothetical protein